jgi:soluble lytic murein transglycosylase
LFIHIDRKKITKTLAVILVALVILGAYDNKIIGKILYPYPYKQIIENMLIPMALILFLVVSVMREESHFLTHSSSHKGQSG